MKRCTAAMVPVAAVLGPATGAAGEANDIVELDLTIRACAPDRRPTDCDAWTEGTITFRPPGAQSNG